MSYRIEKDTLGEIKVDKRKYWGAQTQRSINNFPIGTETMPTELISAFGILKQSAAIVNHELGQLEEEKLLAIQFAVNQMVNGVLVDHFPLVVWQTGSGTQTNMNVNEVIAHVGNKWLAEQGSKIKLHPNDDVNKSQSSNDTFPTAMHIASVLCIENRLFPVLEKIKETLHKKIQAYSHIVKIGRTHLQDATPLTFSQEISGWLEMITQSEKMIQDSYVYLDKLAIGGTAVGTGLNAHHDFAEKVCEEISQYTNRSFTSDPNKFYALTSHDAIVHTHGALKGLAANMMKIANDIRWLASGPRAGIGEITIPANEPGSSIMPGKVNPTQTEAITMVATQVMGNDTTIGIAASQGNFQLNVYKPVIIYNFLQSIQLLADSIDSFDKRCMKGLQPNQSQMSKYVENSLMLVTALNPHIGYEKAATIAKNAYEKNITLKESAVSLNVLSDTEYDRLVQPEEMIGPKDK
ncbi:Fumarate hydratase class II [Paraliobacillus sp. PM-2]|uniref:class II fumarate hydratase n=1 Tax=Paraliobacillus sp. PM-2 TaxID=1462524 RepID=UPI00061C3F5D|nr:class II fumarate hydratase [Paraliobacillus sp. PM-2]CQR47061.1 Fumarate hydratase class II [Paraliobacillus sp. PM-2]